MLHNIFILDLCSTFIVKMFTDQALQHLNTQENKKKDPKYLQQNY